MNQHDLVGLYLIDDPEESVPVGVGAELELLDRGSHLDRLCSVSSPSVWSSSVPATSRARSSAVRR